MIPEPVGIGIRTIAVEIDPMQLARAQLMFSDEDKTAPFFFNGDVDFDTADGETLQRRINRMVPNLHFMSILIFKESHYDPLLVIEFNYDGDAGQLWPTIEDCIGNELRELLRCTKSPRDNVSRLYDEAVLSDQPVPLTPYLEAISSQAATPYRGARGLSRAQILQEYEIYKDVQAVLDKPNTELPGNAAGIHKLLKTSMADKHNNYLQQISSAKTPWRVRIKDVVVLIGTGLFAYSFVVFLLALPVVFLYLAEDAFQIDIGYSQKLALVLAASFIMLYYAKQPALDIAKRLYSEKIRNRAFCSLTALLLVVVAGILLLGLQTLILIFIATPLLSLLDTLFNQSALFTRATQYNDSIGLWGRFEHIMFYLYSRYNLYSFTAFIFGFSLLWAWLRYREVNDSTHDGAQPDADVLSAMAARENYVVQNHMGSLLTVKPGILRYLLVRISHALLAVLARVVFTDGMLGSMRTIHFAHWVFVDKGNRLLFLSNFDGSWESYLDDFTEKASAGVNLAWSQCIGFPRSYFVLTEGSERGGQFKNWARHSMTETLFWYSAYPELSVEMIHRNHRLAKGLSKQQLPDYSEWVREL